MQLTPVLNSRDILARIGDLECYDHLSYDEAEELHSLKQVVDTCLYLNEDWDMGEDMWRDDYFAEQYSLELGSDGDDNGDFLPYEEIINLPEVTAEFSPIEVLDAIYWIRCT